MEKLRQQARAAIERDPWNRPDFLQVALETSRNTLSQLWQDVSSHDSSNHLSVCENLFFATCFLDAWDPLLPNDGGPQPLKRDQAQAIVNLFNWASLLALPSSEFAVLFDETAEVTPEIENAQEETRVRANLAVNLIVLLASKGLLGLQDRSIASSPDVVLATAIYTSEHEPWTSEDTTEAASMHIDVTCQFGTSSIIERILKEKIRPLFSKSKSAAITSEGRKNLHPVPPARFDGSALDDLTKPWKNTDIYAISILHWIISQYTVSNKQDLESHFPLLVPAILALIDDSSIPFKIKGCELLSQLLKPIQESGTDILTRTNLVSVFEEAITPCLLSLPTITPEESSLKLLGAAYPALLSLIKTAHRTPSPKKSQSQKEKDSEMYTMSLAKYLRSNLISSFHHISSSTAASLSATASFPHPRLSTFLLDEIAVFVNELGVHTTKYLQDLIPVLYTAISNPFGTAHPPLLLVAIKTLKTVLLNAHPRVWRWRGEILGAMTACWLHIVRESKTVDKGTNEQHDLSVTKLIEVTRELQRAVSVLKLVLQNPKAEPGGTLDPDQVVVKESVDEEWRGLVGADAELEGLLFPERVPRG